MGAPFSPLLPTFKKVKFLIFGAISMKFKSKYIPMFTINK